jgi:TolA-binding protein
MLLRSNQVAVDDVPGVVLTHLRPGSERLLIYFSSADAGSIQGVSKLTPYDTSIIFVRDPGRGWYNLPINGFSKDGDDLAERLANRIGNFPRHRITTSGSSMGGYAALLFGIKLGVGRVVSIAPQIVLHPDIPHSPKTPVKYDDLSSLIASKPASTEIDIWYGAESVLDLYNILRVTNGARLHAIPGAMHNILATLKRRGLMEAFFKHIAVGGDFAVPTTPISVDTAPIIEAAHAFYRLKDYRAAIETLEPKADDICLSAVYFLLGNSYFRLEEYEKARIHFERAATTSGENYDANHYLGLTLEKLGKDAAAERAFARGVEVYPSPNGVRLLKLASAQYRIGSHDQAIDNHLKVLELDKRQSKPHFELGVMLMKKGRTDDALRHFREHAKANPTFAPTQRYISKLEG